MIATALVSSGVGQTPSVAWPPLPPGPFVQTSGDAMFGNLDMGPNAVVLAGGSLTGGGGMPLWNGLPLCVVLGPCPYVDESGDTMTGDLTLGGNSLVFNGGPLAATGTQLEFAGSPVCVEGGACPYVDEAGDTMTGDLTMGPNSIVFNGGALETQGSALQFNGKDVCLAPCGVGPKAAFDDAMTSKYMAANGACVQHQDLLVTLTVPGPGTILINGATIIELQHTPGVIDDMRVRVGPTSPSCAGSGAGERIAYLRQEEGAGYHLVSLPLTVAYEVTSGGTYSYTLWAFMYNGASAGDRIYTATVQAVWYPN